MKHEDIIKDIYEQLDDNKISQLKRMIEKFEKKRNSMMAAKKNDSSKNEYMIEFLREFANFIPDYKVSKYMGIVKNKKKQYNVRIPKEFADTVHLDSEKDKLLFSLELPKINSSDLPKITAELIKNAEIQEKNNNREIIHKDSIIDEAEKTLEIMQKKDIPIKSIPFTINELVILKILLKKRKSSTALEIASETELSWPTIKKYLETLKNKHIVIIDETDKTKFSKWMIKEDVFIHRADISDYK